MSPALQISFYRSIWFPLCSSFIFTLLLLSSQEEFLCVRRHPVATELHPGRGQCSAVCWNHRGTLVSNSITGLSVKMADRSKPIFSFLVVLMTIQTLNVLLEYFSSMVRQVSCVNFPCFVCSMLTRGGWLEESETLIWSLYHPVFLCLLQLCWHHHLPVFLCICSTHICHIPQRLLWVCKNHLLKIYQTIYIFYIYIYIYM